MTNKTNNFSSYIKEKPLLLYIMENENISIEVKTKMIKNESIDDKKTLRTRQASKRYYDKKGKYMKQKLYYSDGEKKILRKIEVLENLGYTVIPPKSSEIK